LIIVNIVLGFVLFLRIQKDDALPERQPTTRPTGVEARELGCRESAGAVVA
jgi:hypothetical protein